MMFCFAKQKLLITSDNTAYLVTAFIQKPPPKFFFRSATEKLRILVTLSEIKNPDDLWNFFILFLSF